MGQCESCPRITFIRFKSNELPQICSVAQKKKTRIQHVSF